MANNIELAPVYYDSGIAGQIAYKDYQQKVAMTRDITDSIASNTDKSIAANAFFNEFMEIQAIFAENMKKYRKQAKITQEKLAELCNTDHRYIGQIETGHRCPSLEFIEKIATALNIAPYRLFYDESHTENEWLLAQQKEQKQKIKTLLVENVNRICVMIDEQQ